MYVCVYVCLCMWFSFMHRKCLIMASTVLKLLFKLIGFGNIVQHIAYYTAINVMKKWR
jgi:hypothetical protein